ncbi:hypothetical protein HME9302_00032 [Alteripontixanthobacter maritimus]|uniref:Tyr recombinase domain-containing protein n=1 Tax=Alteripontixanthobacter maritimus TaxID=2161824 RepID=A0A369QA03_9SPHN|nr:site-specific integrase [Alteripontixanthobacter maritimus]RDC59739.1 hypothetical protein HME9302_00934 [Alteripontixanthobacter maritimus]RDC66581.1 hypothetical protein HME9302_00032 [Alteripontixanthobacter maritimus]
MAKLPKMPYVKFVRSKGEVYAYFNTGQKDTAGQRIYSPMGKPSSVGFQDTYATLMGHRTRKSQQPFTVADLAEKFENSPEFDKLKLGTRRFYKSLLKHVKVQVGMFPIDGLKRSHIVEVVGNRLNDQPGTRNGFLALIGVLYRFARRNELTERPSPSADIPKFDTGSHEPWPEAILYAGLEAEHERTRLAIALLYYTGQRIGDVVRFRWNDVRGGALYFTQQKTDKPMEVPLHSSLKDLLDGTPKRGMTILSTYGGLPMTPQVIRREVKAFAAEHDEQLVPHGLRKNSVNALLESGCTIAEVAAITGQSFRMVEKYARRVSQRQLGNAAILKLENKERKFKRVENRGAKPA